MGARLGALLGSAVPSDARWEAQSGQFQDLNLTGTVIFSLKFKRFLQCLVEMLVKLACLKVALGIGDWFRKSEKSEKYPKNFLNKNFKKRFSAGGQII